jgi:hypothetical protein
VVARYTLSWTVTDNDDSNHWPFIDANTRLTVKLSTGIPVAVEGNEMPFRAYRVARWHIVTAVTADLRIAVAVAIVSSLKLELVSIAVAVVIAAVGKLPAVDGGSVILSAGRHGQGQQQRQ